MKTMIRQASIKDTARVQHVLYQAHKQNVRCGFTFPAYNIKRNQLCYLIRRDRYYLLVVNGITVGTVAVKRRNIFMEIGSLALLPAYRKRGYGSKLLRYAEFKIKIMKWSSAVLFTPNDHPFLPSYYRKNGYRSRRIISFKNKKWIQFNKKLI